MSNIPIGHGEYVFFLITNPPFKHGSNEENVKVLEIQIP